VAPTGMPGSLTMVAGTPTEYVPVESPRLKEQPACATGVAASRVQASSRSHRFGNRNARGMEVMGPLLMGGPLQALLEGRVRRRWPRSAGFPQPCRSTLRGHRGG